MNARQLREVKTIAESVRKAIECDEEVTGMCFEATKALEKALRAAGYKPKRVLGTFQIDDPNPELTPEEAFESGEAYRPIHHWVELDRMVVDVTASQFNDEIDEPMPDVVVGTYADLGRYTPLKKSRKDG